MVTRGLFREVLERARQSPRRRMNYNFHPSLDANPHRFLNAMLRRTYIAPHRHLDPPKAESFLILEGQVAFFLFEDSGRIQETHILGERSSGGALGIDVAPGLWHTLAVLSAHAVCYEVKPGPYSASSDKDFAPWAPREGQAGWESYLSSLVATVNLTGAGPASLPASLL